MNWCKSNKQFQRFATAEQARRMGQASQRIQAINRLNREPPLYHPTGRPFCGLIYSLNLQYDDFPVEQTILLFEGNRRDSYRAVVNNAEYADRGGWHDWHELNAKAMQLRFIE